jgi:hypothetical protein
MEIIPTERTISVDSLDLLNLREEAALERAGDDLVLQEQVRQEFERIRCNLAEVQKFEFVVAPLDFVSQWQAFNFARSRGLWDPADKDIAPYMLELIMLLMQVKSWTGFEANGAALACTDDNKVLVFGQAPLVIQALQTKLAEAEAAERKNSLTSPAG